MQPRYIAFIILGFILTPWAIAQEVIRPGETFNWGGSVICADCPPPPACNSCCEPCPEPTQAPPTSTPPPTAPPASIETGCSQTVAASRSAVQTALNGIQPGRKICVGPGEIQGELVITRNCTQSSPCALVSLYKTPFTDDGEPVANYTGGNHTRVNPGSDAGQVQLRAQWWTIKGFEVYNAQTGVKVYAPNNIIQNNFVHNNKYGGIMLVPLDTTMNNTVVEDNWVKSNGFRRAEEGGGEYPGLSLLRQVHGIYISNYNAPNGCKGSDGIVLRRNVIQGHGGRGIQWNGENCSTKLRGTRVLNNWLDGNSWGMSVWGNVEASDIDGNHFSTFDYPSGTEDWEHPCIGIYASSGNTIRNNQCYSPWKGAKGGGIAHDFYGSSNNTFINNTYSNQKP